jgi:predicted transcriptional regulator
MKIKEVMVDNNLKYCSTKTKLLNTAKIMREVNCGVLPVVDKENKILEMIEDRDICLSLGQDMIELSSNVLVKKMSSTVCSVKETDNVS